MSEKRLYFYEKDKKGLDLYDAKNENDEDYKYHYNVLPHPYFGDIKNARVIFLAKNPSYSEYEDEYDTWKYFEDTESNKEKILDKNNYEYDEYLEQTYLFKDFSDGNNKSFYNSWKWWNKKVIGHVECNRNVENPLVPEKIAFMNLCGYQSREFFEYKYDDDFNKNWFGCSKDSNILKEIINNKDKKVFFIIVWGRKEWSNFLNKVFDERIKDDFFDKKLQGRFIVLNQYKSKSGEIKSGRNINSLEMILDKNNEKANFYDESIVTKLNHFFQIKKENKV